MGEEKKEEPYGYIYLAENIENGKVYVGKAETDVWKRKGGFESKKVHNLVALPFTYITVFEPSSFNERKSLTLNSVMRSSHLFLIYLQSFLYFH